MREVVISILMPVYNSEKYLKESIESIINQTFTQWELIIINDGSTDNSKMICDNLVKVDDRIKVIDKKNTGVSDTRNMSINNASGKYIGFVDSDDVIETDMFEILINKIEKYNSDLVVCGIVEDKIIDEKIVSNTNNKYYPKECVSIEEMKYLIMEYMNSNLLNSLCNKLYKKEIIDKHNITFNSKVENGEDFIFNLEYMEHIKNLVFCEEQLYHYSRRENESITHKYVEDMYFKGLKIHDILEKFLVAMNFNTEENKKTLCKNHLIGVFSAILNLFHSQCPMTFKQKKEYIRKIIERDYVKYCAKCGKKDSGIVGITATLVNTKSTIIILTTFKAITIVKKFKYV